MLCCRVAVLAPPVGPPPGTPPTVSLVADFCGTCVQQSVSDKACNRTRCLAGQERGAHTMLIGGLNEYSRVDGLSVTSTTPQDQNW